LLELEATDAAWGATDAVVARLLANPSEGLWRECIRRGDAVASDAGGTTVPASVVWRISPRLRHSGDRWRGASVG
jgi:hypothetical protein